MRRSYGMRRIGIYSIRHTLISCWMAVSEAATGVNECSVTNNRRRTLFDGDLRSLEREGPLTGQFLLSRLWLSGRRAAGQGGQRFPTHSGVCSADANLLTLRRSSDSRLTTEIHSALRATERTALPQRKERCHAERSHSD
jgi:hypothetical protein